MSVPDIVKKVFRDFGFSSAFKDALSGSYKTWDYCVQYRETAFDFVSRLMELEGIYYYFTHEDGNHTLVLSDSYSSHGSFPGYATAIYLPPNDRRAFQEEFVSELTVAQEVQTGKFALNAFDFEAPKKTLKSTTPAGWGYDNGTYEVYDYPGKYTDSGDGDHYSRVFMDELAAQQERVSGSGNVGGLAAGSLVTLERHPLSEQNREYLLISTDYRLESDAYESTSGGDSGLDVQVNFVAQAASRQYRSERLTPKPIVRGPQTAMVVGKSGEEIWTDKYGRVKVQFHWDRNAPGDETSSCWVRVAQVWGGKRWGGMAVPRIGQEVIVDFLEGDPDQPIITGRVYNGESMPVYGLPGLATVTGIKSNSSKGGGGFNELRFEDKKGSEQVFLHAERNLDVRVRNDRREWIKNDRHLMVEHDKLELVKNERHEKVSKDHLEEIGGKRHLTVKGEEAIEVTGNRTLTVKANMAHVFKGNHTEETTGNYFLKAAGVVIEASSGITLKCGGNSVVIDPSGVTVKGSLVTIDGSMVKIASGPGSPPTPGSPGSPVSPQAPKDAEEADNPSAG
jgi:type VI secretion system secreted protein VgrG